MGVPSPLPDTERIVDWDELPERVRQIPADFNPFAQGVLMAHQSELIRMAMDRSTNIALCVKGRRTGITFAYALHDTITAATARGAGGDNIWYMADTREKGLEFIGYVGRFAQIVAHGQATRIEQHIFVDQTPEGGSRNIQAFRVRFASGYRVTALSSRPQNIHGLQGIVDIDEAALHKDVGSVLESAIALLIWGGKIRVWSTQHGKQNAFNQLYKDILAGLYGRGARAIRITFDDAVENGLYERICAMHGDAPTEEGKRDWYTSIRTAYGPRLAAMREELDCVPRDGSGASIPGVWIERSMPDERPILRWVLDDGFSRRDEEIRKRLCNEWIERELRPQLDAWRPERAAVGMDFARHRHFTIIMPAEIDHALMRHARFLIELSHVPTRQQEQILWALLDHVCDMRRTWSCAIDATGPGQTIAEYTADRYGAADHDRPEIGGHIYQVNLSPKWYGTWMQPWVDSFEDGTATYPRDANLEADFRAVEEIDGIPRVPKIESRDLREPELYRHGDGAIAAALMWYASLHQKASLFEWTPASRLSDRWDARGRGQRNQIEQSGVW